MKFVALLSIGFLFFVIAFAERKLEEGSESPSAMVSSHVNNPKCSDGWRITGYYTPVETDFTSGESRELDVRGVGRQTFDAEFLRTIFDEDKGYGEGWGKTRFGWYLGNYNGRWHKANAPLDANDQPLEANTVAVDHGVIPNGSIVQIPGLPGDWSQQKFKSDDVGVSVHGKHIDVYTGEGRDARRRMWQITFEEQDIRVLPACAFSLPRGSEACYNLLA